MTQALHVIYDHDNLTYIHYLLTICTTFRPLLAIHLRPLLFVVSMFTLLKSSLPSLSSSKLSSPLLVFVLHVCVYFVRTAYIVLIDAWVFVRFIRSWINIQLCEYICNWVRVKWVNVSVCVCYHYHHLRFFVIVIIITTTAIMIIIIQRLENAIETVEVFSHDFHLVRYVYFKANTNVWWNALLIIDC